MTDRELLIWAAGFYDGEGSTLVHVSKPDAKNRNPYGNAALVMRVAQVRREPLARLASLLPLGHLRGPYRHSDWSRNAQPQYEFVVKGKAAEAAIRLLLPYLTKPKVEQYHAAMDKLQIERDARDARRITALGLGRSRRPRKVPA